MLNSYFLCTATTLTSWHLLVTFCSLHVALWMKLFEHKPFDARAVMGFGILNGISIGLLNLSLGFNSVGFYQVIILWNLFQLSLFSVFGTVGLNFFFLVMLCTQLYKYQLHFPFIGNILNYNGTPFFTTDFPFERLYTISFSSYRSVISITLFGL